MIGLSGLAGVPGGLGADPAAPRPLQESFISRFKIPLTILGGVILWKVLP